MRPTQIESYRDASGARHELVVRETPDGGWRVLDLDLETETAWVIETLTGEEDGRPQAEAIARDYLRTVGASTSAGRTPRDPIPEQGGPDARHHPRPRPGSRQHQARGTALPRAAR